MPRSRRPSAGRRSLSRLPRRSSLPLELVLPYLFKYLSQHVPALSWLGNIFGNTTPGTTPGGPTPPASVSGKGVVASLTADSTSLTVGQTTTARLWVQQSSPNTTNDNGVFSVAVNIEASPAAIVQSQVPVTILSGWDQPVAATVNTGTATATGGIDEVVAGLGLSGAKDEGISGPVEVFDFTVKAVASGTVTLTPTNFIGSGLKGVVDYLGNSGDEANYQSIQITVQ